MFSNNQTLKDCEDYLRKNLFFTSNKRSVHLLFLKMLKKISKKLKKTKNTDFRKDKFIW